SFVMDWGLEQPATELSEPTLSLLRRPLFPLTDHLQETPRMNFGDSVQDASRSGPDDVTVPGAVGGDGDRHEARSLRPQKSLQDIKDLIDRLAAVTQLLRHPGRKSDGARVP